MKIILIGFVFVFVFLSGIAKSQNLNNEPLRFIEVTGSSELEIEPDEIRLIIGIEEYWKEEFDKKTTFKDYKTKTPLTEIEKNLIEDLNKIGIPKEHIFIREVGNFWRYKGKEFLFSKQFELILTDFKKVDEIINTINTRGIGYMRIGELKNKNITEFRKQVKIESLKAAKMKAEYLLSSINKKVGEVISIVEMNENNDLWQPKNLTSNVVMQSNENSGIDNFRKIKLRYETRVKFEIK
jgi:uncharacterized protein